MRLHFRQRHFKKWGFPVRHYLPAHLIKAAQAALDGIDLEVNQLAHNALSMAGWHVARGEPEKALARLRRAQAHIRHGMEGSAA